MTGDRDNIIDITAEREKRNPVHGCWLFSLDVFLPIDPSSARAAVGDPTAKITGFDPDDGLSVGDRMRRWAANLEAIARIIRQQAHSIDPDKDGELLAVVKVWESSRVQTWVDSGVDGPERVAWMHRRFDDAKTTVRVTAEGPQEPEAPAG